MCVINGNRKMGKRVINYDHMHGWDPECKSQSSMSVHTVYARLPHRHSHVHDIARSLVSSEYARFFIVMNDIILNGMKRVSLNILVKRMLI